MPAERSAHLQEPKCGDCKNFRPGSVRAFSGTCRKYEKFGHKEIIASHTPKQTHLRLCELLKDPEFALAFGAMKRIRRVTCFRPK